MLAEQLEARIVEPGPESTQVFASETDLDPVFTLIKQHFLHVRGETETTKSLKGTGSCFQESL